MCEVQLQPGAIGNLPAKKPCVECPLRKDANRGALGGYSPEMYLNALHGPADMACHISKGFHERDHQRQRSCAGVAAYRASVGYLAAHPRSHTMEAVRVIGNDPDQIAVDLCFYNPHDFYAHHFCPEGEAASWSVLPKGRDPSKPCGGVQ